MRQFDAQERRGVGRDGPRERGSEAGEKGLDTTTSIELSDDGADGNISLGSLEARLDGIDREDGDPHGDTSGATGAGDGHETQLALWFPRGRITGGESALDVLIGGEIGGTPRTITGECGGRAAKDRPQAALGIKLADDVDSALVFRLLAWLETLALDLQYDLDPLEGRRDGCHGDRAEETRRGDLGY